jgi:hypothetical protein
MPERERERERQVKFIWLRGITGGVGGYTGPRLWVPWTSPQGCMVHCSPGGTDCSSHCDRGTGCTSTKVTALSARAVWSVVMR